MAHCKLGEKATVNYSFKGVSKSYIVAANMTPVEVNTYTGRVNTTSNYKDEGFTIRFYSPNNFITQDYTIKDYLIYSYVVSPTRSDIAVSFMQCGKFNFDRDERGNLTGPDIDVSTLVYKATPKCPGVPSSPNKCRIEVKSKGIIIFQDQGECPASFEVICGEGCPRGTVKCLKSGYPGFCCLPCGEIKSEIKAIASQVRRLTNG